MRLEAVTQYLGTGEISEQHQERAHMHSDPVSGPSAGASAANTQVETPQYSLDLQSCWLSATARILKSRPYEAYRNRH